MKNLNLFMSVTLLANFGYVSASSEESQVIQTLTPAPEIQKETINQENEEIITPATNNQEATLTNLDDCAEQLNSLIANFKKLSATEQATAAATLLEKCENSMPDLKTTLKALQAEHNAQTLESAPTTNASLSDKE